MDILECNGKAHYNSRLSFSYSFLVFLESRDATSTTFLQQITGD